MSSGSSDIGIQRIIEKQMRTWELHHAQRPAKPPSVDRRVHPFVAISRMVGTEGPQIARKVGGHLGRPVFDKELLDHIASSPEARERLAALVDERDVGWLEEILWPVTIGSRSSGRYDYFRKLSKTILTIARQGPAIFLGRGTAMILPQTIGLRVKIIGSLEHRVRRFGEVAGLGPDEARRRIERIERERESFLGTHFPKRPPGELSQDLVINMDRLSVEVAAEIIAKAAVVKEATDPEDAGLLPAPA
jgi:hypothetical protein